MSIFFPKKEKSCQTCRYKGNAEEMAANGTRVMCDIWECMVFQKHDGECRYWGEKP